MVVILPTEINERKAAETPWPPCQGATAQLPTNHTPSFPTTHNTRTRPPLLEWDHTHHWARTTPISLQWPPEPSGFTAWRQYHSTGVWCFGHATEQLLQTRIWNWKWYDYSSWYYTYKRLTSCLGAWGEREREREREWESGPGCDKCAASYLILTFFVVFFLIFSVVSLPSQWRGGAAGWALLGQAEPSWRQHCHQRAQTKHTMWVVIV